MAKKSENKSASKIKSTVHLRSLQDEYDAKVRAMTSDDFIAIFKNGLKSYEANHPHWHLEVLVSLIKWGLLNLKSSIEKPAGKITWDNPLVELHYPVEWDWNSPREGDIVHGKQILGKFTKENTKDFQTLNQTLAEMMGAHFNVKALGHFTNGAWFEKRAKDYLPYLPAEFDTLLKEITDENKRHAKAQEIFRPFSIGTARVDISDSRLKKNAPVPKKINERLKTAFQQVDIPGISFNGNINGRKIWAGLVFEIHPLVIDCDKQKSYHAITVGLAFEHKIVRGNLVSFTPAKWVKKDQETFWNKILKSLNKVAERLIPKEERQASIIMRDDEGLEITRTISKPEDIETARKWITDFGNTDEKRIEQAANLERLLLEVKNADTSDKKGKALEELVALLFNSVSGFTVDDKRIRTETEEIDLAVSNGSENSKFKREEAIILIECKNWSSKCGKNEFVVFRSKMANRSGRCSLGFLISWNGFADTITKEMLRGSHEKLLVVPIDGNQIQEAIQNSSFLNVIMSAWDRATML